MEPLRLLHETVKFPHFRQLCICDFCAVRPQDAFNLLSQWGRIPIKIGGQVQHTIDNIGGRRVSCTEADESQTVSDHLESDLLRWRVLNQPIERALMLISCHPAVRLVAEFLKTLANHRVDDFAKPAPEPVNSVNVWREYRHQGSHHLRHELQVNGCEEDVLCVPDDGLDPVWVSAYSWAHDGSSYHLGDDI